MNSITLLWGLASYQRHLSLHVLIQFLIWPWSTARHMNWLNHLVLCCTGKFLPSRRCGRWGNFSIWYWHCRKRKNKKLQLKVPIFLVYTNPLSGRFWKAPLETETKILRPRMPVRFWFTSKWIHPFFSFQIEQPKPVGQEAVLEGCTET